MRLMLKTFLRIFKVLSVILFFKKFFLKISVVKKFFTRSFDSKKIFSRNHDCKIVMFSSQSISISRKFYGLQLRDQASLISKCIHQP